MQAAKKNPDREGDERALRHIETRLALLEAEERQLAFALQQLDADIAHSALDAMIAETRAAEAREAVSFLATIVQTPYMRSVDRATSEAIALARAQQSHKQKHHNHSNLHGRPHGLHGPHCKCH